MMRFLTDEDFNHDILRGVLGFLPEMNVLTVQEVSLTNVDDPIILAWAAQDERVVLTHDAKTMTRYALQRVNITLPMPGVVVVRKLAPLAICIDDLIYLAQAGGDADFRNQVVYIPL